MNIASPIHNTASFTAEAYVRVLLHRYKAYFRWEHYPHMRTDLNMALPDETEACASVTSAFLQVTSQCRFYFSLVHTDSNHMNTFAAGAVNTIRCGKCSGRPKQKCIGGMSYQQPARGTSSVLFKSMLINAWHVVQLLSNNTRRTKVVELSSGTHRYSTALPYILAALSTP